MQATAVQRPLQGPVRVLAGTGPRGRRLIWQRRRATPARAFKGEPEPEQPAPQHPVAKPTPKQQDVAAPKPEASVTFKVDRHVPYGHVLRVVGGLPHLGDWDCEAAPAMTWGEGDQWLLTLDLPAGTHQFKVVEVALQKYGGCAAHTAWEEGPNRVLQVPAAEASGHGAFTVVCEWSHTAASLETLPPEELEAAQDASLHGELELAPAQLGLPPAPLPNAHAGLDLAPTDDEEPGAALREDDLRAEPYAGGGDEGEAPVGVMGRVEVGKMTLEGQPAAAQRAPPSQQVGAAGPGAAAAEPPPAAGGEPAAAQVAPAVEKEEEGEEEGKGPAAAQPAAKQAAPPAHEAPAKGAAAAEEKKAPAAKQAAAAGPPAAEKPAAATAAVREKPAAGKEPVDAGKPAAGSASVATPKKPAAAEEHAAGAQPAAASTAAPEKPAAEKAGAGKKGGKGPATNGNKGSKGFGGAAAAAAAAPPAPAAATKGAAGGAGGAAQPVGQPGGKPGSVPAEGGAAKSGSPGSAGREAHAPVKMEAGDYPSQTPMGKGADEVLGGEPAGGLKPSSEAAVKEELRQAALTGSKQEQEAEQDEEDEGGPRGGGGSGGGGGGAAAKQEGRGEREPPSPPASSAASASGQPPAGWQLALAAAGLAALPVVAWSEWVLKSTGCGLPPGPGGLLGAAEGLSYLLVGGMVLSSLYQKISTGKGLPAGPGGVLGAVEGGSWALALVGLAVLGLQVQQYGYIPSALPDANCFGQAGPASAQAAAPGGGAPAAQAAARQLAAAPPLVNAGARGGQVLLGLLPAAAAAPRAGARAAGAHVRA